MLSLDLRLQLATIAVLVWLATDFGVAISAALVIAGLGAGAIWSQAALRQIDNFSAVTAIPCIVANIAAVVFVARWIYRANENAHTLSDELTISPGWAIGWYFVPFAALFKPFQAMRETWQASLSPHDPSSVEVPQSMQMWWGLWILTGVLGNIGLRLSLNAKSVDDFVLTGWIDIIAFAVDVPLTVLLIMLMRQISANQRSIVDTAIFE